MNNQMPSPTNYARHVGVPDPGAQPDRTWRKAEKPGTKAVVFFTGPPPAECVPQSEWAFYRRPLGKFQGRIIGESGCAE